MKLITKLQHNVIKYNKVSRFYNFIEPVYSFVLNRFYLNDKIWIRDFIQNNLNGEIYNVLDCGCGNASIVTYLPNKISYQGIDVSNKSIAKAQKLFPNNNFECTSVLEFKTSKMYQLILLNHFLSVSPTAQTDLLKVLNMLSKGGFIVIIDHNKSNKLRELIDSVLNTLKIFPGFHFNYPINWSLNEMTDRFKVIKSEKLNLHSNLKVLQKL